MAEPTAEDAAEHYWPWLTRADVDEWIKWTRNFGHHAAFLARLLSNETTNKGLVQVVDRQNQLLQQQNDIAAKQLEVAQRTLEAQGRIEACFDRLENGVGKLTLVIETFNTLMRVA